MKHKKLKLKKTIDGNYLSVNILLTLHKHLMKLDVDKNNKKHLKFIIKKNKYKENNFNLWLRCQDREILFLAKNMWGSNTVWYWFVGYYILDFIETELKRENLSQLLKLQSNDSIEIPINYEIVLDFFENIDITKITSSDVSRFLYKRSFVKDSLSYQIKNELNISKENKVIWEIFRKLPYLEKRKSGITCNDSRVEFFLSTLIDGITGNIENKEIIDDMTKSISEEIITYKSYFDVLKQIEKYKGKNTKEEIENILDNIKESLEAKLRKDFRKNLIEFRKNAGHLYLHDLSSAIKKNELTDISWYIEAAHIVPVHKIIETIFEKYKDDDQFQDKILYDPDVIKYANPKNGILLPFNYHRFYDKGYFHFDEFGKMVVLEDENIRNILLEFGIDDKSELNIEIDEDIAIFLRERNKIFKE